MKVEGYKLIGTGNKVEFAGKTLQVGKKYVLTFIAREDAKESNIVRKKMKLVAFYEHHVRFQDEYGIRRSFGWWDLERMLKGMPR